MPNMFANERKKLKKHTHIHRHRHMYTYTKKKKELPVNLKPQNYPRYTLTHLQNC